MPIQVVDEMDRENDSGQPSEYGFNWRSRVELVDSLTVVSF
jgi:hypothetical protein